LRIPWSIGRLSLSDSALGWNLQVLLQLIRVMVESDASGTGSHGIKISSIEDFIQSFSVKTTEDTEILFDYITSKVGTSSSALAFYDMRLQSSLKSLEYPSKVHVLMQSPGTSDAESQSQKDSFPEETETLTA
jgi:hypothetical protein